MCVHQDKYWLDNPHLIYMIEGQGKPESCWTGFGEHIGGERLHPLTPPRSRCPHHSLSPHSLSLTLRAGVRIESIIQANAHIGHQYLAAFPGQKSAIVSKLDKKSKFFTEVLSSIVYPDIPDIYEWLEGTP